MTRRLQRRAVVIAESGKLSEKARAAAIKQPRPELRCELPISADEGSKAGPEGGGAFRSDCPSSRRDCALPRTAGGSHRTSALSYGKFGKSAA